MSEQRSSVARLASLLTAGMLASAACAAGPARPLRPPLPASAPTSTGSRGLRARPRRPPRSPSSMASRGSPTAGHASATDGRWAIFLVRPDGSDAHEIAADVPGEHKPPPGRPTASDWPSSSRTTTTRRVRSGRRTRTGRARRCSRPAETSARSACSTRRGRPTARSSPSSATPVAMITSRSPSWIWRRGRSERLADFTHPDAVNSAPTLVAGRPDDRLRDPALRPDQHVPRRVEVATVPVDGGKIHRLTKPGPLHGPSRLAAPTAPSWS